MARAVSVPPSVFVKLTLDCGSELSSFHVQELQEAARKVRECVNWPRLFFVICQ